MKRQVKKQTIPFPDNWKEDFRAATFRSNFQLYLSQPMLEFLCACADGVQWDRTIWSNIHRPDNFIATGECLVRRGLIVRKSQQEIDKMRDNREEIWEYSCYHLTPAGQKVVELLEAVGMFIESDAATVKKARGRRAR